MAGAAARLRREGPRAFGEVRWNRFLETGNLVLRSGVGLLTPTPVDAFFAAVDDLRRIDDTDTNWPTCSTG